MSEGEVLLEGSYSSIKRRDLIKAGIAGTALALYPDSVFGLIRKPKTTSTEIIDIHAHVISPDTQRYPVSPISGKMPDWSKERPVGFEEMITDMDEAGVGKAALVHSSTTYGYNDAYLADSVARDPKRFVGVFSVNPTADDAPEKIRYWATQRKLEGFRLFANADIGNPQSTWLTEPKTFAALEVAQTLGLPVCLSLRMQGVPQLQVIVKRFPKTKFIIDHMVEPPIAEGPPYAGSQFLFDLAQYQNVYLKVTTPNFDAFHTGKGTPETFFPLLVDKFGASRIAWGSNFPAAKGTLKDMLLEAQTALAVLSEQDREWIFSRTAQSLYPSLAGL